MKPKIAIQRRRGLENQPAAANDVVWAVDTGYGDGQTSFDVKEVLHVRTVDGRHKYTVRWEDEEIDEAKFDAYEKLLEYERNQRALSN